MPLLREVPPPTSRRTLEQRVADKRARDALHRRCDQLEQDLQRVERSIRNIELAVPWLHERDRAAARRRLRELGHDQQLDSLSVLRDARTPHDPSSF